jgi:hypothetical protein
MCVDPDAAPASCHPSGTQNFDVAPTILENLCTPATRARIFFSSSLLLDVLGKNVKKTQRHLVPRLIRGAVPPLPTSFFITSRVKTEDTSALYCSRERVRTRRWVGQLKRELLPCSNAPSKASYKPILETPTWSTCKLLPCKKAL